MTSMISTIRNAIILGAAGALLICWLGGKL